VQERRHDGGLRLLGMRVTDPPWTPEDDVCPSERWASFQSRVSDTRADLLIPRGAGRVSQLKFYCQKCKSITIIIIMHFISGSMAHKNTASEKTETD